MIEAKVVILKSSLFLYEKKRSSNNCRNSDTGYLADRYFGNNLYDSNRMEYSYVSGGNVICSC